jgi:hypothetical protein
MCESSGVPLPGETALITGAVLASQHRLQIALVIALAAGAAILGDNAGYLIGRKGGRWLLLRPGPFARHRAVYSRSASLSSPATARRRYSWDAGCSACAPLPRGSPARATCHGARSCSGTLPARSAGRPRSACSATTSAKARAAPSLCSEPWDSQARSGCLACCWPASNADDDTKCPAHLPAEWGGQTRIRHNPRLQLALGCEARRSRRCHLAGDDTTQAWRGAGRGPSRRDERPRWASINGRFGVPEAASGRRPTVLSTKPVRT